MGEGAKLVVGRVISLAGGKAKVAPFGAPHPSRDSAENEVIEAAVAFVGAFDDTKRAGAEYRALQRAVRALGR